MTNAFLNNGLLSRLPEVRGKLIPEAPLKDLTRFRVGGPAEVLFKPADENDLRHFLANCPEDVPLTVLGVASNTLVRDGGIPGVVVKLGPAFAEIKIEGTLLTCGAGAVDMSVARTAQMAGLAGLEFLSGIPGTIGGALRMNAGAYGCEVKDILVEVTALDRAGSPHLLTPKAMNLSYRHCDVPADWIFTRAVFEGDAGDPEAIRKRIEEIQTSRAASQPIHDKTCGSTFANPLDDPEGRKAWQLIDAAGCRGLKIGEAQVSPKHSNFLVNTGRATAADIEALGEEVRRRVAEKFGVDLRWEVQRIGIARD
ncbi:MAG: UDP-N-acetylmuramate dehydrogenase [Alphaproteobacteria bacterium]|nr:UDP-N-acetylmuramate dehydrogenase [Alphaproteobacteria bacterium]